ncbi:MAG TPA: hypothetical protein VHM70_24760 [Polyangiaceae bacterium]|nr:hypothetical protein [Polyangiaceae bacterium]
MVVGGLILGATTLDAPCGRYALRDCCTESLEYSAHCIKLKVQALCIELTRIGVRSARQVPISIRYNDQAVGEARSDSYPT